MPFLTIRNKQIHYTDLQPPGTTTTTSGGSNEPPRRTFIFIHGLGSSQNYYHAVASRLAGNERIRCILFDNTGAGRSPLTPAAEEPSIEGLARDVVEVLDALEVRKAVVVGHSMGGIVAAHLAAEDEYSNRVEAAILIGPVYPSAAVGPVFEKRIETVQEHGMQPMADSIPQAAVGSKASPLAKAFIRELLLAQDPEGYCANCRVIVNARVPRYSMVKVPVLIVAGEEDKSAPLEGCRRMLEEVASERKRLEVLGGVGHWQCIEAPEEVGRLLVGFEHDMDRSVA